MSLFPEKNTTAVHCAKRFRELMKERPGFWAENVVDSIQDMTNSFEQIDFLRYMADPKGVTPGRNQHCKTYDVDPNAENFHTHKDFKLTARIPGKIPTYKFDYCPDEKEEKE